MPVHRLRALGLVSLAAIAAMAQLAATRPSAADALRVEVADAEFRVLRADGTAIPQIELPGTTIRLADRQGGTLELRIDAVERYELDPEIPLYTLATRDAASGDWNTVCAPGADGRSRAFPMAGSWTADGRHLPPSRASEFAITCTAGAMGKCALMGYKPWAVGPSGQSLWAHHQACVRLLRADYCGDGRPNTRDGTKVAIHDRIGIRPAPAGTGLSFEAAWGPNGAICVAHTRIADLLTLAELAVRCPGQLPDNRLGADNCRDAPGGTTGGEVLVLNAS